MELVPETVSLLGLSQSDRVAQSPPLCFETGGRCAESKSERTLLLASAALCPGCPGVSKCAGTGKLGSEAG